MARRGRKTNGEEAIGLVALLPWWLGLLLAVVSYFFFHALAKPPAIAVARVDQVGTAVIGGLTETTITKNRNSIPILGELPLIGNLFKHTLINVSTSELLFFVTPRIIPG